MSELGWNATEANALNESEADVGSSSVRNEHLAVIEISTLAVILVMAVSSNLTMLIAIYRQRRNRPLSRMYFFMMHLSLADLLVAIFNILPQLAWDITYRFYGGDFLCRFVKYAQIATLYLSTYILMFMAVDRYRAVCCRNLHWNSLKMAKNFVAASWILSLVFSIPQAVIFGEQEVTAGVTDCWVQFIEPWGAKAYVTWFVISIFAAPLLVIIVCYGIICRQIWVYSQNAGLSLASPTQPTVAEHRAGSPVSLLRRWFLRATIRWQKSRAPSHANKTVTHSTGAGEGERASTSTPSATSDTIPMRNLATLPRPSSGTERRTPPQCCQQQLMPLRRSNSTRITKAKMKTIKLTLAVVICFVACWAPFCITQLVMVYYPPSNQADVSPVAVIILLLASLNSCTNPWVYLAFSGSLLNQMRVCLGLHWRRGKENDSIGEDDRRGAVQAVGQRLLGDPVLRRQSARCLQRVPPAAECFIQAPIVPLPCSRADVITHLCNKNVTPFSQSHLPRQQTLMTVNTKLPG